MAIRYLALTLLCLTLSLATVRGEDEPLFSGPQEGERMADFKILDVLENEGRTFQFMEKAGDGPAMLIFVHKVTRPSIGLIRKLAAETALLKGDGFTTTMVFLGDDATELQRRVKQMRHALPESVTMGISPDKQEGPGAYGLNRNVTLTVLVGNAGKVVANFALVQPSVQADAVKIVTSAYKAAGKKKAPTLAEMLLRNVKGEQLRKPLAALLDVEAKNRDAGDLIKQLDAAARAKPETRQQLAAAARTLGMVVQDQKYEDSVRAAVRRWGQKRGMAPARRPQMSAELTSLLRAVINKSATEEQVIEANAALEAHIKTNAAARAHVGRVATTIANSDKIGNYGTPKAQEFIREWAKKYGKKPATPRR